MTYLYIALGCLASWWILWVLFLAVMLLKLVMDNDKLPKPAYYIGLSILGVGWLVDFLVNMIPATLLFLEPPFELTVTARCERHMTEDDWQGAIARWLCRNLLDPFQVGGHCHA